MKKILLCCAAGMSTSLLVNKMKAEAEKTAVQKTSQTVAKGLKALAHTGVSSTATVGLGALVLLSALVLRRKNNK